MPTTIVTIGAYGYDADRFFAALQSAQVDTFCDIRRRRGVRGADYAFANRQRLEARLAELGIRYLHFPDLSPSHQLRSRQDAADKAEGVAKRKRVGLSERFITGYRQECLGAFDSRRFVESLGPDTRVAALFCVERKPDACHRSLVAERLQSDLGLTVLHLQPE